MVTGENMLFVNSGFVRSVVGYKQEEVSLGRFRPRRALADVPTRLQSEYLLKFLYDHIAKGQDFQCRVKWEDGDVICWDNRR